MRFDSEESNYSKLDYIAKEKLQWIISFYLRMGIWVGVDWDCLNIKRINIECQENNNVFININCFDGLSVVAVCLR